VILALGNTGCGKSTMLNSLINGSDSLRTFRDKQKKKMVIQVKDGFKEDFLIGHSTTTS
jgi:predicted GTPase